MMQCSLDETVKYVGYESIKSKAGKEFIILSVVDKDNKPLRIFADGDMERRVRTLNFGDELSLVFNITQFGNNLNCRCIEVIT